MTYGRTAPRGRRDDRNRASRGTGRTRRRAHQRSVTPKRASLSGVETDAPPSIARNGVSW